MTADDQGLASQLLAFCGRERYRKFVLHLHRQCQTRRRLLFWQEELWAAFSRTQPNDAPSSFEGVSEALRLCPVHDLPLRAEEVPIVYGLVGFPADYLPARDEHFPFANEVSHGGCCVGMQTRAIVLVCDGYRQEDRAWRERTDR